MARFETLLLRDAQVKSATGKRAEILREYLTYIDQLRSGEAGSLQAGPGETLTAVRRRLGAAAMQAGKSLTVRRSDDRLYFWLTTRRGTPARRRGRPPKQAS